MQEQINALRAALEAVRDIDHELRGEIVALGLALAEKLGDPYTYGIPGSDPNVEQLPDGRLKISLITPIASGTEVIDTVIMRVPTLGDAKMVKAKDGGDASEIIAGVIEKVLLVCTVDGTGRKLTRSQAEQLTEEDGRTLAGALTFLSQRFRRTGKTFKTS